MSTSTLHAHRDRELSLGDLADAARDLLARAAVTLSDERVAAVPDGRTLRYYQSIGVMDRPIRYEGRQAIYGYRSLLQAVAVKLLQSRDQSLAQIQAALAGATTAALEAAVAEAVGVAVPAPLAPPAARLLAVEVAPGVLVTVDPRLVSDPESVIHRIQQALGGSP